MPMGIFIGVMIVLMYGSFAVMYRLAFTKGKLHGFMFAIKQFQDGKDINGAADAMCAESARMLTPKAIFTDPVQ